MSKFIYVLNNALLLFLIGYLIILIKRTEWLSHPTSIGNDVIFMFYILCFIEIIYFIVYYFIFNAKQNLSVYIHLFGSVLPLVIMIYPYLSTQLKPLSPTVH